MLQAYGFFVPCHSFIEYCVTYFKYNAYFCAQNSIHMTEEPKKCGRGGRREGAGRPKGDSKLYTFRVPGNIAKRIDAQPNKTDFIKGCIVRAIEGKESEEPDFSKLGEVRKATDIKDGVSLPFFDINIVAGFPLPLDNDERGQDIELLKMLCPHPEASYLIRVVGDSMIDAGVCSGDIIIVDKSNREPDEKQIAVCELNGEYTLKRFVQRENGGWLVPANTKYPEIQIKDGDDFSVWGTVTFIIHKPRV